MILFEKHRSGKNNYLYCQSDKNLSFAPHIHNAYEFLCVKKGALLCGMRDTSYKIEEGNAVLIFPNEIHSYTTPETSESFLCVFSSDYVGVFDSDTVGSVLENPIFKFGDERVLNSLSDPRNKYESVSSLYFICASALRHTRLVKRKTSNDVLEGKILYYIQENYDKEINLALAASQLGYNYSYLSRVFNKIFGESFTSLVNEYRLNKACALLKSTDYGMVQISNICGFNSLRNFNNAFLVKYGMSPSEYRESANK